jgi:hypothetical protein
MAKKDEERLTQLVAFRMTPEESEFVTLAATRAGLSKSVVIRAAVRGVRRLLWRYLEKRQAGTGAGA